MTLRLNPRVTGTDRSCGPEQLIKTATGQHRATPKRDEAAAARCSIALLLRRPSVNPLSKSAFGRSSTFRPHRAAATTRMTTDHERCRTATNEAKTETGAESSLARVAPKVVFNKTVTV